MAKDMPMTQKDQMAGGQKRPEVTTIFMPLSRPILFCASSRSGLIGGKPISDGRLRTNAYTRAAISRVIIPTDRKVILQPMTLLTHARGALEDKAPIPPMDMKALPMMINWRGVNHSDSS